MSFAWLEKRCTYFEVWIDKQRLILYNIDKYRSVCETLKGVTNMKKRLISLLLAGCMTAMLSVAAFAADTTGADAKGW